MRPVAKKWLIGGILIFISFDFSRWGYLMMSRKTVVALAGICAAALLSLSCENLTQTKVKDPVVKVGKVTIGKASFDVFHEKVARIYPSPLPGHFPGSRKPETFMAESEAIWQFVKSDSLRRAVEESLDWKWKEKYFKSALFFELLTINLGFTDAELEEYYKKHKEEFRVTVKSSAGEDSTFVPLFDQAKRQAADRAFFERYPPDSAFVARLSDHDHDHDDQAVRNYWLYHVRSNPADFYMRQFFFEQTGNAYESEMQVYGEEGVIRSDDLDIVRAWVPENRRGMRMKDLIEWLYKWHIFAEHAEKRGLVAAKDSDYKEMIHWVLRIEHALAFLRTEVEPHIAFPELSPALRNMAELHVFDQMGRAMELPMDRVQTELNSVGRMLISVKVDSVMLDIRNSVKVEWLQEDLRDDRGSDPAKLFAVADSLREAALSADVGPEETSRLAAEAEMAFRNIATDFAFVPEGRRAMSELAKLQIDLYSTGTRPDQSLLRQAIAFYRRMQLLESDMEILCNSYFMIGFAYDEYLKNYSLAEANYKWILSNAPTCALASDAEFMMLHLGEPMASIEEIQGRSIRQGRKVEFDEDAVDIAS